KNQRLQVELALLKMCHIATAISLSQQGSLTATAPAEVKKKRPDVVIDRPATIARSAPRLRSVTTAARRPVVEPVAVCGPKRVAESDRVSSERAPLKKGWGKISTSLNVPNVNTIFEDKAEEEAGEHDLVQGNTFQEVTFNAFIAKWNAFADRLKTTNRITLYTIMTANPPRLSGVMIEVDVENAVQMDELKLGKIDILNYLRVELQNFSLDITGVQVEVTKVRKPYTSIEK